MNANSPPTGIANRVALDTAVTSIAQLDGRRANSFKDKVAKDNACAVFQHKQIRQNGCRDGSLLDGPRRPEVEQPRLAVDIPFPGLVEFA